MISGLRSIAQAVTPIALDIYDKLDSSSVFGVLAQLVPNPGREKVVTVEWWSAFPQLRKWIGERTVQRAFQNSLVISGEPYEITMEFDRRDAERASGLVKAEELAGKIARAFARGKVMLALRALRMNALTYDGQSFFDADHTHPDGSAFSNLVEDVPRSSAAYPTVQEARNELKLAQSRLMENRLIRDELVEEAEITASPSLIVLTRSQPVWSAYRDLRTEERIGTEPNRFRNTFRLLRDFNPPPGQANTVDVIEALPDGPRPTVFVATREPEGLQFDETKVFSHNQVPFGMDAEYGVAAGFPQTAVRVLPVGIE
jgi:phage major head subunit gpT-like protein